MLCALELTLESGLGEYEGQLYDRPCPPNKQAKFQRLPAITADMARAGVGRAGRVSVAASIWRRCMPDNLLDVYLRRFSSDSEIPCPQSRSHGILILMLQVVRVNALGFRSTSRPPTGTTFLPYKNHTKCRLLLNATTINATDRRRPPRITLLSLCDFPDRFGKTGAQGLWMAKLDLTNTYWSIRLPGKWRHVFVVGAGGGGGGTPDCLSGGNTPPRYVKGW